MAETYRKSKVEHYVAMLQLRKKTIKQQIEQEELKGMRDYLQGQLSAIDLIVNELQAEFHLESTTLSEKEHSDERERK
jgi:hypothetical protein